MTSPGAPVEAQAHSRWGTSEVRWLRADPVARTGTRSRLCPHLAESQAGGGAGGWF